eukprot:CAMPEP_0114978052 /NCGR_PEP_ID=MMETSP0216-20121206/3586_1 /TAXON_ID=223996 /ORGANISM="Protocruzia adherens, Strain Boccale" /LENGTH=181 /DNA_ID=CAMNT_0002339193 /DNA_START=344 /DNA_END=889 /DNA_ORIENTATION=-
MTKKEKYRTVLIWFFTGILELLYHLLRYDLFTFIFILYRPHPKTPSLAFTYSFPTRVYTRLLATLDDAQKTERSYYPVSRIRSQLESDKRKHDNDQRLQLARNIQKLLRQRATQRENCSDSAKNDEKTPERGGGAAAAMFFAEKIYFQENVEDLVKYFGLNAEQFREFHMVRWNKMVDRFL